MPSLYRITIQMRYQFTRLGKPPLTHLGEAESSAKGIRMKRGSRKIASGVRGGQEEVRCASQPVAADRKGGNRMAIYEYQCVEDGVFEINRPIGTAPAAVVCALCGHEAARIVSAPRLVTRGRSAWRAAMDRAEKSRYEPQVVSSVPSAGARSRTRVLPLTPTLRGLPRP